MDPDETFRLMLTAFGESSWDEAKEHAEALLRWLRIGGFPPQVTVGIQKRNLLFDFQDEWLNRVAADGVARTIVRTASSKIEPAQ